MQTSKSGRALIEQREGRRLAAYRDSKGILTIGVGHTGRMSPPAVKAGMTITEAECDAMLAADLAPVEHLLNAAIKVPISQNEFDAMASLGFNIGIGGLKGSTVVKRLNGGDVAGAAAGFMMWAHPAVLAGRREAEAAQFLASDADAAHARTIASARAATLATRAELTKSKAQAAQSGSAALVVVSGATIATAHGHHPTLAFVAGGVVLLAAACAALVALFNHQAAQALAVNAGHQALAAQGAVLPLAKPIASVPDTAPDQSDNLKL